MRTIGSALTAGVTNRSNAPDGADDRSPRGNVTPAMRAGRIDRVLHDLRTAGYRGFCSFTWYREGRPNDRNAPSEINDMPGFLVRSSTCVEDDHPRGGTYARHWLDKDPESRPTQLSIL